MTPLCRIDNGGSRQEHTDGANKQATTTQQGKRSNRQMNKIDTITTIDATFVSIDNRIEPRTTICRYDFRTTFPEEN